MAISILLVMLATCCLLSTAAPLGEHKSLRRSRASGLKKAPEFLLKINKCFRIRNEGVKNKAIDCIKFAGNEVEVENILASNTVWGFVGNCKDKNYCIFIFLIKCFLLASIQNSEARMSFAIKSKTLNETIYNVDLQLFKDQLSEDHLKNISTTTCNLEHGITLILKSIQSKDDGFFMTNITLSQEDLLKKQWIGFHGLKMWYIQLLEKSHANITTTTLHLSTLPKCASISLGDLGIKSHPGYEPLMVVYSDASKVQSEENLYKLLKLKLIAKRSTHTQLETNSSSGVGPDPTIRCQLINYNVRDIYFCYI